MINFQIQSVLHFLSFVLLFRFGRASEIDSFTRRAYILSDKLPPINAILNDLVNDRIDQAMKTKRGSTIRCDDLPGLNRYLFTWLGRHPGDPMGLLDWIEHILNFAKHPREPSFKLPVVFTPHDEHVYASFDLVSERGIVSNPRVGGFATFKMVDRMEQSLVIGSDKTSHFLSTGYEYFEVYLDKLVTIINESTMNHDDAKWLALQDALRTGTQSELTFYGLGIGRHLSGTYIYSYADLAANYAGMAFWLQLTRQTVKLAPTNFFQPFLSSETFKSTSKIVPYFKCNDHTGYYERTERMFDWTEYVHPGWDESINAIEFGKPAMKKKFLNRLNELYAAKIIPRPPTEPQDIGLCKSIHKKWKFNNAASMHFVHPQCRRFWKNF